MDDPPAPERAHRSGWLAVVIAAGVLARVVVLARHPPLNPDEVRYLVTAHHLRCGGGYENWHGPEIDILPLHPLLTAATGADPGSLEWRGRLVAFAASILSLPALAALAWQVAGPTEAIIAVAIASLHPWLVAGASTPQPESLYVLVALLGFLAIARLRTGHGSPFLPILAGAFLGCAYLARPEGLIVAFLAGGLIARRTARRRVVVAGVSLYAGALLVTILPYLVWLHGVTGRWVITGKGDKVFFIGQAMHASGGAPPTAEAYLALQREYGDWKGFVRANPGQFLGRLLMMGRRILGWILPRALGPLAIVGWCALLIRRTPRGSGPPAAFWTTLPALVLPLMTLTYPNERVAATAVPFLLIPASAGLHRVYRRLRHRFPARALLAAGALLLGLSWYPAAMRPASWGGVGAVDIESRMATEALASTKDTRAIATNSPVVSFHLRDPDLFGAPGIYRPLESGLPCSGLVGEMRRRGATLSVIDRWPGGGPPPEQDQDCPLVLVERYTDPVTGRRVDLLRLAP